MLARTRGKTLFTVALGGLLMLAVGLQAQPAAACTWSPPTPWFITRVTLVSTHLPSALVFQETDRGGLRLVNNSGVSLWILADFTYPENPKGLEIAPGQSAVFGDALSSMDVGAKEVLWIDTASGSGASLRGKLQTRNRYGDQRPANPQIPQPQTIALRVEMDQQQLELQLRITYQSNPDYQPVTLLAYDSSCSGWLLQTQFMESAPLCGLILLAGIVAALLALAYVRWVERPDRKNPSS